jgi:hypothetical protein
MKKGLIGYFSIVLLFFVSILFSVRYIVNTTRIYVGYEEAINPTEIFWNIDSSDSILRVQDPLYLTKDYYLCNSHLERFKNDSVIMAELFKDSIPNKGSIINLKPPFVLWKNSQNDTIKIFKNE